MLLLLSSFMLLQMLQAQTSPVQKIFPQATIIQSNINYAADASIKHLLDIYLPAGDKKNLPLVVWIHGGALIGGAAGATIGAVTAPERTYYY